MTVFNPWSIPVFDGNLPVFDSNLKAQATSGGVRQAGSFTSVTERPTSLYANDSRGRYAQEKFANGTPEKVRSHDRVVYLPGGSFRKDSQRTAPK